jgi:hypothetical protein
LQVVVQERYAPEPVQQVVQVTVLPLTVMVCVVHEAQTAVAVPAMAKAAMIFFNMVFSLRRGPKTP